MENKDSQAANRPAASATALPPGPPSHPVSGIPPEARYDVPPFEPVPVKPRHDGWTPERQNDFIEALAATACVEDAARAVGMSSKGAYLLRVRPDAVAFRAAWDAALHFAVAMLEAAVFSRAIHGVPVPRYYKGEVVGEHRRYNDQLAMFLMRHNDQGRYTKGWDKISPRDLTSGARTSGRALNLFNQIDALNGVVPEPNEDDPYENDAYEDDAYEDDAYEDDDDNYDVP